jgi:hypothetical protein
VPRTAVREQDFTEIGQVRITQDQPEVGLVTLSYEPSLSEYNMDAPDGEQTLIMPEVAFRKAAREYFGDE